MPGRAHPDQPLRPDVGVGPEVEGEGGEVLSVEGLELRPEGAAALAVELDLDRVGEPVRLRVHVPRDVVAAPAVLGARDLLRMQDSRGEPSGDEIHANIAKPVNLRRATVSPKKTRGGSFRIRTSTPSVRHWLWMTCSTSSRVRSPAVVMSSRRRGSPAPLRRMPSSPGVHPASSRSAAAAAGSWEYVRGRPGMDPVERIHVRGRDRLPPPEQPLADRFAVESGEERAPDRGSRRTGLSKLGVRCS